MAVQNFVGVVVPVKIKAFLLVSVGEHNPHLGHYIRRDGASPNIYCLCMGNVELVDHLFIQCPFSKGIWKDICVELKIKASWDSFSFIENFSSWIKISHVHKVLPCFVFHGIWKLMNKIIFDSGRINAPAVVHKFIGAYLEWCHGPRRTKYRNISTPIFTDDVPLAFFDDASQDGQHKGGATMVIILEQGHEYGMWMGCGKSSHNRLELLALWGLLYMGNLLHVTHLQVEGD